MLNSTVFITLLSLFSVLWIVVAWWTSRSIKNDTDYYLADRQLGVLPITLTLLATQIGGGFLSGIAQESYHVGLYGIAYALGISAGFILLSCGIAARLRALNIETTAELFETRYGSPLLKKVASTLSIISLWGILVAQIVAFKTIMYGLGIYSEWVTLMFWLSIIIYTMIGGLKASVFIDIFKETFVIIMFFGIFFWSFFSEPTSWLNIHNLFAFQQSFDTSTSILQILPIFFMPTLFCLIEQDLAQCFFAARTQKIAVMSAIYSSIFLLLFAVAPVYFGMKARLDNLPVLGTANPLIVTLDALCTPLIFSLAVIALVAAISTTANSLLCAVSGNLSLDFDFSWLNVKNKLRFSKIITLCAGLSALVVAYLITERIVGILTISYELSVSCLLVPSLVAYYKKDVYKSAAALSMCAGLCGFILFRIIPLPINREVATLLLSGIGYLIGHALNNKKSNLTSNFFF